MEIISKKKFSISEKKEIEINVLKSILPNVAFKSNIKITISDFEIIGDYQRSKTPKFIIDSFSTIKPKKSTKIDLDKLSKKELQSICTEKNIEFESDNNKATLIKLINSVA